MTTSYDPPVRQLSRKQQKGEPLSGEERAMLTHFGGGPFAFRDQELWYRLTPDTVRLLQQVVDDAVPRLLPERDRPEPPGRR